MDWAEVDDEGRMYVPRPASWNGYASTSTFHKHNAAETLHTAPAGYEPPWCHGQPMLAAPVGWVCRVKKTRFPMQDT
jgi:hypothetical protein